MANYLGKLNTNYKNGKYIKTEKFCLDCNTHISFLAVRCGHCANVIKMKNIWQTKRQKRQIPKCIDCNTEISFNRNRCRKCASIEYGKHIRGKNNPMYGKIIHFEFTKEIRKKMSDRKKGNKSRFWKGGIVPLAQMIRGSFENKEWIKSCLQRDNYTCQHCNVRGGKLEVHHLKPFSKILSEFLKQYNQFSPYEDKETLVRLAITYQPFWDVENGETLCEDCHKKITLSEVVIWHGQHGM